MSSNLVKPSGRCGYIRTKPMRKKRCTKCRYEKFLNQFYNNKNTKDGKNYICKECHSIYYPNKKNKSERRLCIGSICRGQKSFKSVNGARICHDCRRANKEYGNYEEVGGVIKRKGTST